MFIKKFIYEISDKYVVFQAFSNDVAYHVASKYVLGGSALSA